MCSILFALLKTPNIDRTAFESQFKSALQLAAYRGPDSQTVVQFDKNTFLGHARLRIIDFSDASNQPMINGNRAMLFNGEIYNYKSLDPTATSDTRTLFSLIQTDPHFYRQLVGMYAIISYNKETHEGHVFRDFYGEKPVYYFNNDDLFIVSSTIKSILHLIKTLPAISLTSDLVSELEFLTFGFIREPHTIIPSIKALPPGHCLSFTDDSISVVPLPKTPFPIQADAAAQYMDLTYSAADIPATLLLSAGVDSTVVLSHLLARGRVPNISIYRSPNPATDESQQALVHLDILSKAFGVRIQPQVISNVLAPDTLYEYFINGLEQPTSDGLNLYNLLTGLKQSDPDLRLILTGMGGDELFGGYSSFRHPEFSALIPWIPTAARPLLPNRLKRFLRFKPMPYGNPALNYYFLYRLNDAAAFRIDDAHIARLYQRFLDTVSPFLAEKTTFSEVVKTCETFDNMKNQLLRDSDNIAGLFGIESRSPLLSPAAFGISPDNKAALKAHLKSLGIPIKKKSGFTFSQDRAECQQFFLNRLSDLGWKIPKLRKAIADQPHDPDTHQLLKNCFILGSWYQQNNLGQPNASEVIQ